MPKCLLRAIALLLIPSLALSNIEGMASGRTNFSFVLPSHSVFQTEAVPAPSRETPVPMGFTGLVSAEQIHFVLSTVDRKRPHQKHTRRSQTEIQSADQDAKTLLDQRPYTLKELADATGQKTTALWNVLRRNTGLRDHPNLRVKEKAEYRDAKTQAADRRQLQTLLDTGPHTTAQLAKAVGRKFRSVEADLNRSDLKSHSNWIVLNPRGPTTRAKQAVRWNEEQAREVQEKMIKELQRPGAEPALILLGRKTIQIAYDSILYGVEPWGEHYEDGTLPAFVRIGPFFFIDERFYGRLGGDLRREMDHNLIRLPRLGRSNLIRPPEMLPYDASMIISMLHKDLNGKRIIDAGSADGILSIVAAKLGASTLNLIESDPERLDLALQTLRLNGIEDPHFNLLPVNLRDTDQVLQKLKVMETESILLSNIGYWPTLYGETTNADSLRLISFAPLRITGVLMGGYAVHTGEDATSEMSAAQSLESDERLAQANGFIIDPIVVRRPYDKGQIELVAWTASRPPAAPEGKDEGFRFHSVLIATALSVIVALTPSQTGTDIRTAFILSILGLAIWSVKGRKGFLSSLVRRSSVLMVIALGIQWIPGGIFGFAPTVVPTGFAPPGFTLPTEHLTITSHFMIGNLIHVVSMYGNNLTLKMALIPVCVSGLSYWWLSRRPSWIHGLAKWLPVLVATAFLEKFLAEYIFGGTVDLFWLISKRFFLAFTPREIYIALMVLPATAFVGVVITAIARLFYSRPGIRSLVDKIFLVAGKHLVFASSAREEIFKEVVIIGSMVVVLGVLVRPLGSHFEPHRLLKIGVWNIILFVWLMDKIPSLLRKSGTKNDAAAPENLRISA